MTKAAPKHAVTPPKGRPTRSRRSGVSQRRVFGATAQWIAAVVLLAAGFIALFIAFE